MAIARCKHKHGLPKGRSEIYLPEPLTPVGHPTSGVVCGISNCEEAAMLYITKGDRAQYDSGLRVFGVKTNTVKVRVR